MYTDVSDNDGLMTVTVSGPARVCQSVTCSVLCLYVFICFFIHIIMVANWWLACRICVFYCLQLGV